MPLGRDSEAGDEGQCGGGGHSQELGWLSGGGGGGWGGKKSWVVFLPSLSVSFFFDIYLHLFMYLAALGIFS